MSLSCWLLSPPYFDALPILLPDVESLLPYLFLVGSWTYLVPLRVSLLFHPGRLLLGDAIAAKLAVLILLHPVPNPCTSSISSSCLTICLTSVLPTLLLPRLSILAFSIQNRFWVQMPCWHLEPVMGITSHCHQILDSHQFRKETKMKQLKLKRLVEIKVEWKL